MIGTRLSILYKNVHSGSTVIDTSFPALIVGYARSFVSGSHAVKFDADGTATMWAAAEEYVKAIWPDAKVDSVYYTEATVNRGDPFIGDPNNEWKSADTNTTGTSGKTYYLAIEYEHNVLGVTYTKEVNVKVPAYGSTINSQTIISLAPELSEYVLNGEISATIDTADSSVTIEVLDADNHKYKILVTPSTNSATTTETDAVVTLSIPIKFRFFEEPILARAEDWDILFGEAHPLNQIRVALDLYAVNAGNSPVYVGLVPPDTSRVTNGIYGLSYTSVISILSAAHDKDIFVVSVLDDEFMVGGAVSAFVNESVSEYQQPVIAMLGYSSLEHFKDAKSLTFTGDRVANSKALADELSAAALSYHNEYIRLVYPAQIYVSQYDMYMPGFFYTAAYAGAIVNAGKSLNSIASPFTNKILRGVGGANYGKPNETLTPADKNRLEDNGVWLLEKSGRVRHQVTTNVDSVEQREDSIVRTALWIAKAIGKVAETVVYPETGVKNINPELLSSLKTNLDVFTMRLIDIVCDNGSRVGKIEQDKNLPDQINIQFQYKPLYPADVINIQVVI